MKVIDTFTGNPIALINFIDEQSTREIITFQTGSPLIAGRQYKISIKFIAYLNPDLRGFYRSSYVENGVTK